MLHFWSHPLIQTVSLGKTIGLHFILVFVQSRQIVRTLMICVRTNPIFLRGI